MAPPTASVAEALRRDLEALKNSGSPLAHLITLKSNKGRYGFNDGAIYPKESYPEGTPEKVMRAAALNKGPLRGKINVCVVLAEFTDQRFDAGHNKAHFEDLFFSKGKIKSGSVYDYYKTVSNGLLEVEGKVVGPYTLPLTLKQYANGEQGTGDRIPNAQTMAQHAAEAANVDVDFSQFDNAGDDKMVEAFVVVHAGEGAEATGAQDQIWSHKFNFRNAYKADGATINIYITVPEDCHIGVCAHELGHQLFGWPDLYDPDYSSDGLGSWCLMANGSNIGPNGGDGSVPAHPSAWCKASQGWVKVETLSDGIATIEDVKISKTVYKVPLGGTQYLLLENRQREGFDYYLPGPGLLVFLVDDSVDGNDAEWHPQVKLLQADGRDDLVRKGMRGDAGDPFPGSARKTSLTPTTNPSSNPIIPGMGLRRRALGPELTNISMAGGKITLTVRLPVGATGAASRVTGDLVYPGVPRPFQATRNPTFDPVHRAGYIGGPSHVGRRVDYDGNPIGHRRVDYDGNNWGHRRSHVPTNGNSEPADPLQQDIADLVDQDINVVIPLAKLLHLYALIGSESPTHDGNLKSGQKNGNTAGRPLSNGNGMSHLN